MIRLSFDSAYLVLGPAFDPGPVGPVFLGVLANQYLLEAHLLKQTLSLHLPRFYQRLHSQTAGLFAPTQDKNRLPK